MVTSRIWFTAAQKAELWERWRNGQSAAAISRALERKNKTGVERQPLVLPRQAAIGSLLDPVRNAAPEQVWAEGLWRFGPE